MSQSQITDPAGEQLSALMDGELPRDQLRFLLRRIDAEGDHVQRWSRYQLARVVLRRQANGVQLRADFADVVMQRLAAEAAPRRSHGVLRWIGGGAIAASVAVLALSLARPPQPPAALVAGAPAQDARPAMPAPAPVLNFDYAQPASFETAPSSYDIPRYDFLRHRFETVDPASGLPYVLLSAPLLPVQSAAERKPAQDAPLPQ